MTCIVGIKTPEGVYIGGDSAITSDSGLQTIIAGRKVFFIEEGQILLGCTTSCRMQQLLQYELLLPAYEDSMDVEKYLVTKFVNAVRDCLKSGGFAQKEDERELGGRFLVGFRGRLFEMQDTYQINEPANGYDAVGSGGTIALGVLYATPHLQPEERIELALEAAGYHNSFVKPPFHILCLQPERVPAEVLS